MNDGETEIDVRLKGRRVELEKHSADWRRYGITFIRRWKWLWDKTLSARDYVRNYNELPANLKQIAISDIASSAARIVLGC